MDRIETSLTKAATPEDDYKVKANTAAEQFEGFFIGQMLKEMRAATLAFAPDGSPFKDPVSSGMQDMADKLVADKMAGQHAFGIADAILRQLLPAAPVTAPSPLDAAAAPLNAAPPPVASSR
jgi:flagellar protein FlgJ